jgi:hypothetical protein
MTVRRGWLAPGAGPVVGAGLSPHETGALGCGVRLHVGELEAVSPAAGHGHEHTYVEGGWQEASVATHVRPLHAHDAPRQARQAFQALVTDRERDASYKVWPTSDVHVVFCAAKPARSTYCAWGVVPS